MSLASDDHVPDLSAYKTKIQSQRLALDNAEKEHEALLKINSKLNAEIVNLTGDKDVLTNELSEANKAKDKALAEYNRVSEDNKILLSLLRYIGAHLIKTEKV